MFGSNGAAILYHNNVNKFTTTAAGINISGEITASGDISASGTIIAEQLTTSDDLLVLGQIELGHATDTTLTRASAADVNIEGNIIYRAGGTDVVVADGGTGVGTFTDGGVLLGNGTGAIQAMAVLTDGQMIVGDGTTDPAIESGATLRTSIGVGTGDNVTFTNITGTGNTALGNAAADTHTFVGHITASGNISASGDIFVGDDLFIADAGVINYNNSEIEIKHSGPKLVISGSGATELQVEGFLDINGDVDIDGGSLTVGNALQLSSGGSFNFGSSFSSGRITWDADYASLFGLANKKLKLGSFNTQRCVNYIFKSPKHYGD